MFYHLKYLILIVTVCLPLILGACSSRPRAASISDYAAPKVSEHTVLNSSKADATYNGRSTRATVGDIESSLAVPDGNTGITIVRGTVIPPQHPQYVNARELKLKVRELADQLLNDIDNSSFKGKVAIPVAFADQENLNNSSAFGRLLAEMLTYELNQRGIAVKELRNSQTITLPENKGSSFFNAGAGSKSASGALVIAGTYHKDRDVVFLNAKLVNPDNGRVLRTGSLILGRNALTTRMLAQGSGTSLGIGSTTIKSDSPSTTKTSVQDVFVGNDDVH